MESKFCCKNEVGLLLDNKNNCFLTVKRRAVKFIYFLLLISLDYFLYKCENYLISVIMNFYLF